MAGRYGNVDYPRLTKRSFLAGLILFAVGALGELAIFTAGLQVPAWEKTLLLNLEIFGVLVCLLSPFIFGIVLPLTE
ncbi:hypothetical protein [Salinilacihabitans rarus]|uniref:DUF7860 family protein n=1 Tax=Salinilacihabitans rarus TaxID=2961596 RepID=UPI0020C8F1A4|nr:hypothetical protein [Salinilacihabitans rarus]